VTGRGGDLILHGARLNATRLVTSMILKLLVAAGGLLALIIAAAMRLRRHNQITTEQLSGDWLAQARAREEQPW
jgi:hypothetical protein